MNIWNNNHLIGTPLWFITIDFDNGLVPIRHQAINKINGDLADKELMFRDI